MLKNIISSMGICAALIGIFCIAIRAFNDTATIQFVDDDRRIYLQIDEVSTPCLNNTLKRVIDHLIKEEIGKAQNAIDQLKDEQSVPVYLHTSDHQAFLKISPEIMHADEKLISILFTAFYDVAGTAHPSVWRFALNYDLINQQELTLADIYLQMPDYLNIISRACYDELCNQVRTGTLPSSIEINRQGLEPDAKNFSIFTLKSGKISFHFAQYQVAPYSLMPSVSLDRQ